MKRRRVTTQRERAELIVAGANARLLRAQQTTDEARAVIDAERDATRAKTARLKAERLAKEAAERVTKLEPLQPL